MNRLAGISIFFLFHPPLPALSTSLSLSLPLFLLSLATFLRHPLPPLVPRGSAASVDRSESFPTGRNFPTSSLYLLLSESLQKRASENLALSGYPANTGSFFREGERYITSACPVSSIKLRTFIKRVIDRRLMSLSPNFVFSDCLPRRGTASKRWIRNSSHSRKFYSKGEGDKRR